MFQHLRFSVLRPLFALILLTACGGTGSTTETLVTRGDALAAAVQDLPGGASLSHDDRLFVTVAASGGGVRIPLGGPDACVVLRDMLLDDLAVGDWIRFRWVVESAVGVEFVLLESHWERTASTTYTTTKKNPSGDTVQVNVVVSDATVSSFQPFRVAFDRKTEDGVEKVQLEFRYPATNEIKKLFPWGDPEPTSNVALEVTTSGGDFSIGALVESPVHDNSQAKEFGPDEFWEVDPLEHP